MTEQLTLFKIRDLRKKDQFKIDDVYVSEGYARVCKKDASIVYMSLCRHAEFNSQKAFPSQEKIAWEHNTSVRTVRRGLKKLIEWKIIIAEQERRRGKFTNYVYILLDKSEWKKLPTEGQNRPTVSRRTETVGRFAACGVGPTKDNKEQGITNNKDNKKGFFPKKLKPYFQGMQMRQKNGKWYCIPKDGGSWLEFAGKESQIEWR